MEATATREAVSDQLQEACKSANLQELQAALRNGADANTKDQTGRPVIYGVCLKGYAPCLGALIAAGAAVDLAFQHAASLAHVVAKKGHTECLRLLGDAGADLNAQRTNGITPLYAACYGGHTGCVLYLIQAGVDLNTSRTDGKTPIAAASEAGNAECVQALVESGANINTPSDDGRTPAFLACLFGRTECLRCLVEGKADIDASDVNGLSPAYVACQEGNLACLTLLIGGNANLDAPSVDGGCPVHAASSRGRIHCLRALIDAGANIEATLFNGFRPAHTACQYNQPGSLRLLVSAGVDLWATTKRGETPAHVASRGRVECLRELLKIEGTLEATTSDGLTLFMVACNGGHADCVQELLTAGGDVNATSPDGVTAAYFACHSGDVHCLKLLSDAGASVRIQAPGKMGFAPIHVACSHGSLECLDFLICSGVGIDCVTFNGRTPAFMACDNGHVECLKRLIEAGANVQAAQDDGATPAHAACRSEDVGCLKLLVAAGVDVNFAMANGATPLHIGSQSGHNACVQELLAAGAAVNAVLVGVRATPLYLACQAGSTRVVATLLRANAQKDAVTAGGSTPARVAAALGQVECLKMLVAAGADVRRPAEDGTSPAYMACSGNHVESLRVLDEAGVVAEEKERLRTIAELQGNDECLDWLMDRFWATVDSTPTSPPALPTIGSVSPGPEAGDAKLQEQPPQTPEPPQGINSSCTVPPPPTEEDSLMLEMCRMRERFLQAWEQTPEAGLVSKALHEAEVLMRRSLLTGIVHRSKLRVAEADAAVRCEVEEWVKEESATLKGVQTAVEIRSSTLEKCKTSCSAACSVFTMQGSEMEALKQCIAELDRAFARKDQSDLVERHYERQLTKLESAETALRAATAVLAEEKRKARGRQVSAVLEAGVAVEQCMNAVAVAKSDMETCESVLRSLLPYLPELQCTLVAQPVHSGLDRLHRSGVLRPRSLKDDYTTVGTAILSHTVLHVVCRSDGSHKALKQVPLDHVKEVQREVIIPSRLHHPNVMSVELAFVENMVVYVQTAWCELGDMGAWLASEPRSVSECCMVLSEVLQGLTHLHDRHIVHGDLKPANILMDDNQRPRISDWGLSRQRLGVTVRTRTVATTLPGHTPGYAAPELLRAMPSRTSFATDMYAMGRVLEEALALAAEPVDDTEAAMKEEVLRVAKACVSDEASDRPSLYDVTQSPAFSGVKSLLAQRARAANHIKTSSRHHVQWERCVEGKWRSYSDSDNAALEWALTLYSHPPAGSEVDQEGDESKGVDDGGASAEYFHEAHLLSNGRWVLFGTMQETSLSKAGENRFIPVRRTVLARYPFPRSWPPQAGNCQFVQLDDTASDWALVAARLTDQIPGSRLLALHRVQNRYQWQLFKHKEHIMATIPEGGANEQWGWNGTRNVSPFDLVEGSDGLDYLGTSHTGLYGKGLYFAANAGLSNHHHYPNSHVYENDTMIPVRQLLLVRLLCGRVLDYGESHDSTLERAPPGFDSVRGLAGKEAVHVVYDRAYVYPQFVVSYSVARTEAVLNV